MPVDDIVRSMSERMPWPVGSLTLYKAKVERGRGWDNTVAKFSPPSKKANNAEGALRQSLVDHQLYGEKLVSVFDAPAALRAKLIGLLTTQLSASTPAAASYPTHLDRHALKSLSQQPQLVQVVDEPDGISAVFTSARETTVREPVNVQGLPNAVATQLGDYVEVVGIKKIRFQAFDVLYVPRHAGPIEVRVDYPFASQIETALAALSKTREAAKKLVSLDPFSTRINLFPLMEKMYRSATEGTVVELAFATSTGSLKHEKMRSRGLDLRQEIYHRAGMAALSVPIEPYKLSIVWDLPFDDKRSSYPELGLNSTSRMGGASAPTLGWMIVRKCGSADDYRHIRDRVKHYL